MGLVLNLFVTVPGAIVSLVFLVLVLMIKEIVHNEYRGWSPVVARALLAIACRIHSRRAEEWWGDLAHVQDDGDTGVVLAVECLLGATRLGCAMLAHRITHLRAKSRSVNVFPEPAEVRVTVNASTTVTAGITLRAPEGATTASPAPGRRPAWPNLIQPRTRQSLPPL